MTKSEKREAAIRVNPKQVRFDDLNTLLRSYAFAPRQSGGGSSHYTYTHPSFGVVVTIPRPHRAHVSSEYVKEALAAIDRVKGMSP